MNQPFSITPSDAQRRWIADLICSKAANHSSRSLYCLTTFTSFCLFLSLSLSHFSLLVWTSFILLKHSVHANFSAKCAGSSNTAASQQPRTQIFLPLCGDFSFLPHFQPAPTLHLHTNDNAKNQTGLKCSSVHCCIKKKNATTDLGGLKDLTSEAFFSRILGRNCNFTSIGGDLLLLCCFLWKTLQGISH